MNGAEGDIVVETSTAAESTESTNISTSDTATMSTTTTKTTFDELMQALTELEADDPLPTSSHRGPSWREFDNHHHVVFLVHYSVM